MSSPRGSWPRSGSGPPFLFPGETTAGGPALLPAAALFALIGAEPRAAWLAGTVVRNDRGFVRTGTNLLRTTAAPLWCLARAPMPLDTSQPGVFAAGDVDSRSIKRMAAAAGEGATAISVVHEYPAGKGVLTFGVSAGGHEGFDAGDAVGGETDSALRG
jgi:hypothetical protein